MQGFYELACTRHSFSRKDVTFMKISVGDSITIARDIEHAKEIIKEYEAAILVENRVISHYLVDGVEVADIDAYLTNVDSTYIQHIAIIARTPQEIVKDSIATFLGYLSPLQEGLLSIKEKLTMGEAVPQNDWQSLLDGLEWVNQFINSIKNLVQVEGVALDEIIVRWQEQLGEMLTAWENGDVVLLADIMEYEILEILKEFQSYFEMYTLREEGH